MFCREALLEATAVCVLLGAPSPASPALADEHTTLLDLRLQVVEGALPNLLETGKLILERTDRPGQTPVILPARLQQTVPVPLPSRWMIRFEVPGLWGQRRALVADGSAPPAWIFNLRPAGRVSGQLTSRALPLPKEIGLFSELPSGARGETPCPLAAEGKFDCLVPAGPQDLVLTAGAFSPVRFRSRQLVAGKVTVLPRTELQPGASLAGRVLTRDGTAIEAPPAAVVKVFRFVATSKPWVEPPQPLAIGAIDAGGGFAFLGLEPGPVILEVSKAGFSPARVFPLELSPGAEVSLPNPLELVRPIEQVVVEVTPATDVFGLPWRVNLQRISASAGASEWEPTVEAKTDDVGRCSFAGQSPGRAILRVQDSAGNTFYKDADLWLAEGSEAWVPIALPLVEIRGEVSYGGNPLAGTLYFGGRTGERRIELASDDEGRFEGVLPDSGTWPVEVIAEGISTRLRVPVTPGLSKRRAELNIRLPDTLLFGRVVDSSGQPVANATVLVDSDGWSHSFRSEGDGSFEAKALPTGRLELVAEQRLAGKPVLTSDTIPAELLEEQPVGPFELRLRSLDTVSGRLYRSGHRPVAGAVIGLHSRGGSFYADRAATDAEGAFTLKSDPSASEWTVTVMAPGATLMVFRHANDGSPLEIHVEEQGGDLEIELPLSSEEMFAQNLELSLARNGVELGLPWLFDWLRALGTPIARGPEVKTIAAPRLAPGLYTACLGARRNFEVPGATPIGGPEVVCRSGHLGAGGRLELSLSEGSR
jgi:hypothetical protein